MDDEKKIASRGTVEAEPAGRVRSEITGEGAFYSRFVDLSGEAMYVLVNRHFIFVNTCFAELSGYSAEELMAPGFDLMTLIAPVSRPLIEGRLEQIARGETPAPHYAFQSLTRDGRLISVETSVSYISYSGGLATVGVCRDVTDRINLAEKVGEYQQRHRQFADLGGDFIHECRRRGEEPFRFFWLDGAFTRITGYSRDELMEFQCWLPLVHPEDVSRVRKNLQALKADDHLTMEFRLLTKDGRIRWIEDNVLCVADRRLSDAYRLYGACRDVTDRKEAERLYTFLAERSFAGVYVVQDGVFRYLNRTAALYAGYDPEELIGNRASILVHPKDEAWERRCAREMLSGERRTPYEFRIITKNGSVRWIMETVSVFDYQGRPAILGNSMDVTEKMYMEKALQESETRYRQLFENAVEGFFQSTPQGMYIVINPSFARMFGYESPEEMIAAVTNIGEQLYVNRDDRRKIGRLLETQGFAEDFEAEFHRKDRVRIWGTINARAIRGEDGGIRYYEGTIVDITERKKAQEEFRRQYRFLRTLLDSVPVPVYYLDAQGICTECNQAFLDYISPVTEAVIGKPLYDLLQEDGVASGGCLSWGDEGLEEAQVYETVLIRSHNSSPRNVIISKAPIFNLDGSRGGEIVSLIDITDRKEAEKALSVSEEKYRGIFENAIEGIYQSTPSGRFLQVNPFLSAICGYDSPQDMVRNITDMAMQFYADPRDRQSFHALMEKEGRIENCEYRIRRKDGRTIWVSNSARCVRDADGKTLYYEGAMVDITDRKEAERELELHRNHLEELVRERTEGLEREIAERRRAEEALRIAKEAAEAANLAKSTFLSSMSHELRTPLNAVIGFSDVLNRKYFGPLNDKQQEYVQDISASGQHLLSLINDVLDLAKIEAGKTDLYYVPVSVPELLENSLTMIKESTRIHGIDVCLEMEETAAGLTVMADIRRLRQVMYNLLSNAAKFTPDGGRITVGVREIDEGDNEEKGGRFIEISVADTGIGLVREDLEKIFEEFHQVNSPVTGKNPGTGLGLSLARRIVEMHGGRIWAESAGPEKGSAFIFRIPYKLPQSVG